MASILMLSERGKSLPIAGRLKSEGHIVKVWIKNDTHKVLQGSRNPAIVRNPVVLLEQFDLIISEGLLSSQAIEIEKMGKKVMGCGAVTDKLTTDKMYRAKVLDFLGVTTPPFEGITVELTGFMGANGFNPLIMLSLPSYYFMEKDKGSMTEGMGSLVVFLDEGSKLTKTLLPFAAFLLKINYTGPFNLSLNISGELWSIASLNTDLVAGNILAGAELLKTSLFDFLFGLPDGAEGKAWDGYGASVVLSVPPWPYGGVTNESLGLIDVPEQAGKHLSLGDSKLGVLGVATAKGTDVREARRRVYRTVQNAVTSRMVQYRDDIGVIQEKDLQTLKEWGWL